MVKICKIAEEDLFGIRVLSKKEIQKQKKSEQMKESQRFMKNMRIVGYRAFDYINNNEKFLALFFVLCALYEWNKVKNKDFINFKMERVIRENYDWLYTHEVVLRCGKYKLIEV